MDFGTARRMMVDGQVRTSDVTNLDLIEAMLTIPRERFVPHALADLAYLDRDVPVGEGAGPAQRRLLKPMVLAKLIQVAEVQASDSVLDVACGTGYSSAVLSRLAATVVALEEDADLVRAARQVLAELGATNVSVVQAPLVDGCSERAPYDVVLLNGVSEVVPKELCTQLKDGGRLIGIFGEGMATKAMIYLREGGDVSGRAVFDAAAPRLPGFERPPTFVF
jgi:protein-L-isoaspartate(D-aspartate) O-methyltransferase